MSNAATRIAEIDHTMMSITKCASWVGQDTMQFLLTRIGLLGAREEMVKDDDFYDLLVTFANTMYWASYGRMNEGVILKVESLVQEQQVLWYKCFDRTFGLWKEHTLGHLVDFIRRYGPTYLFDAFIFEYNGGQLKRYQTSRVSQTSQIALNYLLGYHSIIARCVPHMNENIVKYLRRVGFGKKTNIRMRILATKFPVKNRNCVVSQNVRDRILRFLPLNGVDVSGEVTICRLLKMRFGVVELSSAKVIRTGQVDNSFVQIDGEIFGCIDDMFRVAVSGKYYFVLKIACFDPITLLNDSGTKVRFPDNQMPRERTNRSSMVLVEEKTFVQKAIHMPFHFTREKMSAMFTMYSVLPTPYSAY